MAKNEGALKLNYTFSVPPTAPFGEMRPCRATRHSHEEFFIDLPDHWGATSSSNPSTFNFRSDEEDATLILELGFFTTVEERGHATAETNVNSQIEAYKQQCPGGVEVLRRLIRPHSSGNGTEMTYAVEVNEEHLFLYFGYLTSRKLVGLLLICGPEREASARLFSEVVGGFRAKSP